MTYNINDYSNVKIVFENAKKYLGDDVKIKISDRPDKKFMVLNPNNNKWIYFGKIPYLDFTKTNDEIKRNAYLKRSENIKGDWKNNKYSKNNLSRKILWNA